ncbi:MAG: hypothetical protein E7662_08255 [Ruminococcaceae bacterium]|nr:hypothetical protein [Oscillospiraceae bacterium]
MLLAKAKDPAFWEKVRTSDAYRPYIEELLAVWQKDAVEDFPAEKYSIFISYHLTGSRTEYQKPAYTKRRALTASALLSLIYPNEEKYFVKLCDVIWAILGEYTWVAPAHMPTFEENVLHHIDLYAAETGQALAEIDYLLADRLPPLIRSRIQFEIRRRIIDSYMAEPRFGWESVTNNWAAVCLGCVVMTVLYQCPELLTEIRPRMDETVRCFLSGFPQDGICLEGFGYWHYGFGFFTCMSDMLLDYSDGAIDFFADPKVRHIVRFPQRMYLDEHTTVSFSDGGMTGRYHLGLLHYLKKKYPDEVQLPARSLAYVTENHGRWALTLRAFLWFDDSLPSAQSAEDVTDFAPHSQWLIKKTPRYGFAAKGGHNKEPHNHNDLGSFIIAAGGGQILCDPGAGSYVKDYFGPKRYESFKASSRGHSVPIIGGQYQVKGIEHSADADFTDGVLTLQLSRAYDIPALTDLTRTFRFTDDTVMLEDRFTLTEELPITERIISRFAPQTTPEGIRCGILTLVTEASAEIHAEENVWCIDYALPQGQKEFNLTVKIGDAF